jgi:hypothetical protein
MFVVTERFLSDVVGKYGEHSVTATYCSGIWYPHQAYSSLKLNHHLHTSYEKSIIFERNMLYIIDRTENLMIIFHVERRNVN